MEQVNQIVKEIGSLIKKIETVTDTEGINPEAYVDIVLDIIKLIKLTMDTRDKVIRMITSSYPQPRKPMLLLPAPKE